MAISLKDWQTPVIKRAIDPKLFNFLPGNRHINEPHVRKLKESMEADASVIKYNPILVNELMEIIDGQHRFTAISRLGYPIFYIMEPGLGLADAQKLNRSSKQWRPVDYAISYHELGNKNYTKYLKLKDLYEINHDILIRYIALGNPTSNEVFRTGSMKVYDLEKTEELIRWLCDLWAIYDRAGNRAFALAFLEFAGRPKYDHKRMVKRFQEYLDTVVDRAIPADYIKDLERIYNSIPR